jgi:L-ascorbate metabolism protein UlaG (beta-lactamase superfamily)
MRSRPESPVSIAPKPGPVGRRLDWGREATEALAVTYLGQVGFALQHRGFTIVIDPYLTDSGDRTPYFPKGFWRRNYPAPVEGGELAHVDLVLCSHDHLDHTDPETIVEIARSSPNALFAGPRKSVAVMEKSGIAPSRLRVLNAGGTPFRLGPVTVHPIAAAHETYDVDQEGYHAYLSFVVRWAGWTLFHAADTVCTPELSAELAKFRNIDVAFLPINGRDAARRELGIVGNMNAKEAASLAVDHSFGLVVPTHYDLCEANRGSLADFVRDLDAADPYRPFKAFRPGEQVLLPACADDTL